MRRAGDGIDARVRAEVTCAEAGALLREAETVFRQARTAARLAVKQAQQAHVPEREIYELFGLGECGRYSLTPSREAHPWAARALKAIIRSTFRQDPLTKPLARPGLPVPNPWGVGSSGEHGEFHRASGCP